MNNDKSKNDSSITLSFFPNKDELKLAVDIFKKNWNIEVFQTSKEFQGINLYAIQSPSEFMGNAHETLRGHGIIIGGFYI
ncbi:MAG: hypothetical protein KKI12_02500 [Proteobacteria bacterium]|nr:hypothetical protein [Pseudomonadota bacterium]MBU4259368.1 hypothetical protein [Pseudomonadota bacterium]MBU4287023.1 hypothetical protein [Pseudomonadota bacterium]MBU4414997.1 hypothetical protein [Pseudomonadota bacterium]MCG2758492.1 hypothetical protein [Desulfobacteraceae bacterium]